MAIVFWGSSVNQEKANQKSVSFNSSLFSQLILIFSSAIVVIIIGLFIGINWLFKSEHSGTLSINQAYYAHLVEALDSPPNISLAEEQHRRFSIDYLILYDGKQWHTTHDFPNPDTLIQDARPMGDGYFHTSHNLVHYHLRQLDKGWVIFTSPELNIGFSTPYLILYSSISIGVLLLLYFLTRYLFSPIKKIQSTITQMSEGDLTQRIDSQAGNELGALAIGVNRMADNIQQMLDAKRTLLLAISHELKTPITRAKLSCEMLPPSKHLDSVKGDLDEMKQLIDELLEIERLNESHNLLQLSDIDINALVIKLLEQEFVAQGQNIIINLLPVTMNFELDAARIRLLLRNLINNAFQYAENISLNLSCNDSNLVFQVIDDGPGIPEEHIPHLTEPFYRVDKARQRQTGGIGLGLYLCHLVAVAHGGELNVTSVLGKGTKIQVSIPQA